MKKLSNTVNHSNKLMLTYFFRVVFINLYFKKKKKIRMKRSIWDSIHLRTFFLIENT